MSMQGPEVGETYVDEEPYFHETGKLFTPYPGDPVKGPDGYTMPEALALWIEERARAQGDHTKADVCARCGLVVRGTARNDKDAADRLKANMKNHQQGGRCWRRARAQKRAAAEQARTTEEST